jgi:hypothetical protein
MKRSLLVGILVALLAIPVTSWAGAKLKVSDDTEINLGFRVQPQFISTNDDGGGTGSSENYFNTRRQRLRLGGSVGPYVKFFLQTDGASQSMIDAFVNIHYENLINVIMGHNMAPAGRQILTSSGGLMAIDRPEITNFNLTWGLNGRVNFNNNNFAQGNQPIAGPGPSVRDDGITLFSSHSFSDTFHGKFYIGVYDGIDSTNSFGTSQDTERVTARVQVNFLDAEPGYYGLSTYLGKKKTIGIGASIDHQSKFTRDTTGKLHDYDWYEADFFLDYPVGPGAITAEVGYHHLDLDGNGQVTTTAANFKETEGDGAYAQAGYYLDEYKIQPWVKGSIWDSNGNNDIGSFTCWGAGLSYFLHGHNANIKVGYEHFKAENGLPGEERDIDTLLVGFYVTY